MRQAIGTTWIMQLVIVFMLIFVAFLALTVNYTKAFKIKNELISIIEREEGVKETSDGSIGLINNYLMYNNYTTKSGCMENEYGVNDLNMPNVSEAIPGERYYYCLKKVSSYTTTTPNRAKYTIRIFFRFSLPIIGDLITFPVEGTTINITNAPQNDLDFKF